jgi:hypothetical protein
MIVTLGLSVINIHVRQYLRVSVVHFILTNNGEI